MTSTVLPEEETDAGQAPLRLSFSRVDAYRSCPLKFRFAYVDQLPSVPAPQLSWGSSIHAALEAWWDQKLPQPPPVDVLLQALYDHWDDEGFAGMARDEKVRWYRHAQDVLRRHHARHVGRYVPAMATEQWFELELGDDITVVGSVDHVTPTQDGRFGVVDWKTNRKAKTRRQVAGSLQLAIYTMAAAELWGAEPDWVALDFVVPGVRVTVDRADIDTAAALSAIREVAVRIRAEAFEPTPSALCPWCDWRAHCPAFEGDGPDLAGTAVVELRRLRRRAQKDAARIAHLEQLVRDRLGDDAEVEVG
ncbi:MAG: RecB family exonuclease [Egibacteraceae bacterium]